MTLENMKTILNNVSGYAIGAFNIVDYSSTRASIDQAEVLKSPIILQTSTKTVKFWERTMFFPGIKHARSVFLYLWFCILTTAKTSILSNSASKPAGPV